MDTAKLLFLVGGLGLAYVYWDDLTGMFDGVTNGASNGNGSNGNGSQDDGIFGGDTGQDPNTGDPNNTTSDVPSPPWVYGKANFNTAYHSEPSSDLGKEIKVRAISGEGSNQANFWQWNYYYQLVTGNQGPDPIEVFLGVFDVPTIENTKISFANYWGMLKQLGTNTGGVAGLGNIPQVFGYPLRVSENSTPLGMERLAQLVRPVR